MLVYLIMFRLSDISAVALQSVKNIHCPEISLDVGSQESRIEILDADNCNAPRNSSNSHSEHSSLSLSRFVLETNNQYLNTSLDTYDFGEISIIQSNDHSDVFSCFVDSIPFTLKALGIATDMKESSISYAKDSKNLSDHKVFKRPAIESLGIVRETSCYPRSNGLYRDTIDTNWWPESAGTNWGQSSSHRPSKKSWLIELEISECANTVTIDASMDPPSRKNCFKKIKEVTYGNSLNKDSNCSGSATVLYRKH